MQSRRLSSNGPAVSAVGQRGEGLPRNLRSELGKFLLWLCIIGVSGRPQPRPEVMTPTQHGPPTSAPYSGCSAQTGEGQLEVSKGLVSALNSPSERCWLTFPPLVLPGSRVGATFHGDRSKDSRQAGLSAEVVGGDTVSNSVTVSVTGRFGG